MSEALETLVEEMNDTLMPQSLRQKLMQTFPPIEIARIMFRRAGLDFEETLQSHLRAGYVVARPGMFSMFRAVQIEQGPAWRIAISVGKLPEIVGVLPFYLPYLTFQRRMDPAWRVIRLDRAAKLIAKMK